MEREVDPHNTIYIDLQICRYYYSVCVCIYIYIYREREREKQVGKWIQTESITDAYIYMCIYIYIYRSRY